MSPQAREAVDLYNRLPDSHKWMMLAIIDILKNGPPEDMQQLEKLAEETDKETYIEELEEVLCKHKDYATRLEYLQ